MLTSVDCDVPYFIAKVENSDLAIPYSLCNRIHDFACNSIVSLPLSGNRPQICGGVVVQLNAPPCGDEIVRQRTRRQLSEMMRIGGISKMSSIKTLTTENRYFSLFSSVKTNFTGYRSAVCCQAVT